MRFISHNTFSSGLVYIFPSCQVHPSSARSSSFFLSVLLLSSLAHVLFIFSASLAEACSLYFFDVLSSYFFFFYIKASHFWCRLVPWRQSITRSFTSGFFSSTNPVQAPDLSPEILLNLVSNSPNHSNLKFDSLLPIYIGGHRWSKKHRLDRYR